MCHQWCVTSDVSPVMCHQWCVTSDVSPVMCHQWCVTSDVSPVMCHQWCVTSDVSPVMCHQWCVTSDVSPVMCHQWWALMCMYRHRVLWFSGVNLPRMNYSLWCRRCSYLISKASLYSIQASAHSIQVSAHIAHSFCRITCSCLHLNDTYTHTRMHHDKHMCIHVLNLWTASCFDRRSHQHVNTHGCIPM